MQRPTSVTIFGIINIALAILGLLSLAATLAVFQSQAGFDFSADAGLMGAWTIATQLLGFIANLVLLASGIGLLRMRPWGRYLAIVYAGYAIIAALVSTAVSIAIFRSEIQGTSGQGVDEGFVLTVLIIGGLIGLGISLLHPTLLWYFMTRPHVAAAFHGSPIATAEETSYEPQAPLVSDNPYVAPVTINTESSPVATNTGEEVLEAVVPIKNRAALVSYYTGLFSLFPVFGLPLAIVAIVSGRQGLRNVKANPEVKGKTHAWIGLVCGWLFGLFNFVLAALIGVAMVVAFTSGP